jgi:putative phosphoribosyl transferase
MFRDRIDAADQLALALQRYRDRGALVLAIPRGAVPMGRHLADRLKADFDVVLVRKLCAPGQPEFAVGAIDEHGEAWIAPHAAQAGADAAWLAREQAEQLAVLRQRRAALGARPPLDACGRIAIVVDDGLATGATMIAALRVVRRQAPSWLVCAVPVAPPDSVARVQGFADEVICLQQPAHFGAVGAFYRDFRQVEDAEVVALLAGGAA